MALDHALEQDHAVAFVAGGSGGIGLSIVKQLLDLANFQHVYTSWRSPSHAEPLHELARASGGRLTCIEADCTQPAGIARIAEVLKGETKRLHVLINCVGFLHDEEQQPEKSLGQVEPELAMESFRVNSLPTVMLAKELQSLFRHKDPAIFAAISARVGSIEDNGLGGWYSYRASKAALNMYLRNIAIEFRRTCRSTCVVSLHPGTTDTRLSGPFQKNVAPEKLFSPDLCARQLLDVMKDLSSSDTGGFFAWDGSKVPW